MKREWIQPRPGWQDKVSAQGFLYHSLDTPYWEESACYAFTAAEVDQLEAATNELFGMCLEAVELVMKEKRYAQFRIPEWVAPLIEFSWKEDMPSIYGRFDLAFRDGQVKLLEFNADTPTSLLEASVVQWFWLKEVFPAMDQFNAIHERLVKHWEVIKPYLASPIIHFACMPDAVEDYMNVAYLMDTAEQAGLQPQLLYIPNIGYDAERQQFLGVKDEPIHTLFKLYPYEFMVQEEFGQALLPSKENTWWIEPAWKMILSNKSLLPLLWEMYPGHPLLLEASWQPIGGDFVKKPIFSREGANLTVVRDGQLLEGTGGEYGREGFVFQRYFELPVFDGMRPVIGSWVIGGEAAGIGIRETEGYVTGNTSRFLPHYFRP